MDPILLCQHCGNKTSHTLLEKGCEKELIELEDIGEIEIEHFIWFVQCDNCSRHSLFSSLDDNEIDTTSLWPKEKRIDEIVPLVVKNAFEEATKVKKISKISFVILIRRALEILCKYESASGKDLYKKIQSLETKGIIPQTLSEMANLIRLLGNEGAHTSSLEIGDIEIDLLDEFFQALVEYVYIAPNKVNRLKNKIKK